MNADDFFAIQDLVFEYSSLLDQGDFDGVGKLFAHATVLLSGGGVIADRDPQRLARAYKDWVAENLEGLPRARHFVSNLNIAPINEEMATATSTLMVFQQTRQTIGAGPFKSGAYRDVLEKENGRWRFIERRLNDAPPLAWAP